MNANVLPQSTLIGSAARAAGIAQAGTRAEVQRWNPEEFASEQIRGLVRRIFFSSGEPIRQVVFSGAEPGGGVSVICERVGLALALETAADVVIVSRNRREKEGSQGYAYRGSAECTGIRRQNWRIAENLWRAPENALRELCPESSRERYWPWALAELRNNFEYVVIEGPAAGASSESILLGQLTDGIIIVLEAHVTRKATARRIKETLEATQCRILGTVLSERTFPVPAGIYRRL